MLFGATSGCCKHKKTRACARLTYRTTFGMFLKSPLARALEIFRSNFSISADFAFRTACAALLPHLCRTFAALVPHFCRTCSALAPHLRRTFAALVPQCGRICGAAPSDPGCGFPAGGGGADPDEPGCGSERECPVSVWWAYIINPPSQKTR